MRKIFVRFTTKSTILNVEDDEYVGLVVKAACSDFLNQPILFANYELKLSCDILDKFSLISQYSQTHIELLELVALKTMTCGPVESSKNYLMSPNITDKSREESGQLSRQLSVTKLGIK